MAYLSSNKKIFAILLSFCLASLAGCAKEQDALLLAEQQKVEPADLVYNEALANFDAGNYKEAAQKFSRVEEQHPLTEWARKALVMETYSYYKGRMYNEVTSSADRYLASYDKSKDAPYVNYLQGLSYFYQIPDITYDQTNAEKTITSFQNLIANYPKSEYVPEAKVKIRFAQSQLASKSMQVAKYYMSHKNYIAALKRYQYLLETYPDSYLTEEALYRCVEINQTLGLSLEARTAAYVLGYNYPDSVWYKRAYDLLERFNVPMDVNKESWVYKLRK